ncbi:MAG TPA: hypothetical protein VHG29_05755 [Novosphingobium sp.]|nr:hypothetical protein [Novosphingobium sp.]
MAHGFGQKYDLPLPLNLLIWSAGGTIIVTFVVVSAFLRETLVQGEHWQLQLAEIDTSPATPGNAVITALRLFAAAIFILMIVAGLFGNQDPYHNLAPTLVWVIWWVGFAFFCALFGNLWGLINPIATWFDWISAIRSAGARRDQARRYVTYPAWLGFWPAAIILASFVWAELIWTEKDVPMAIATAALSYAVLCWVAMCVWGRDAWLHHGEAFSVMFRLLGRFAPLTGSHELRGSHHLSIYLRPMGVGLLDGQVMTSSFVVFVMTLLASVTFDGFLETSAYQGILTAAYSSALIEWPLFRLAALTGLEEGAVLGTFLLVLAIALFAIALFTTSWLMRVVAARALTEQSLPSAQTIAGSFVLSLVPIAVAYHLAHYLSLLLTVGQFIIPLSSDPFGLGWDLFGTANFEVKLGIVGPRFFWYSAISAILIGHMLSVYIAHLAAIRVFGTRRAALLSQIPMVGLMVGYTMSSLWILAQPIVG